MRLGLEFALLKFLERRTVEGSCFDDQLLVTPNNRSALFTRTRTLEAISSQTAQHDANLRIAASALRVGAIE